jgi:hypothetical protein
MITSAFIYIALTIMLVNTLAQNVNYGQTRADENLRCVWT